MKTYLAALAAASIAIGSFSVPAIAGTMSANHPAALSDVTLVAQTEKKQVAEKFKRRVVRLITDE
ncbi:MAG TPA: hypothetical protein DIC56_03650, partial [Rhizobium sp.]|nr:hypothetical protein [Rhizobium sp.]